MQLKTREDYLRSLDRFEGVFQARIGTKESIEADTLAHLIHEYEETQFVIKEQVPSA